jgi:hypothetical protein
MATTLTGPRLGSTAVLRRQPARIAAGQPEGGYTDAYDAYDAYEVICRSCGDDPSLDYREVSPRLQRLRGPYWLGPGVAALEMHLEWHGKRRHDPPAERSR